MMRLVGYSWALPITICGLLFVPLALVTGGRAAVREGVVEASGGCLGRFLRGFLWFRGGAAMTLGHVILARDLDCLNQSRGHELMHVRQYELWGPFFIPTWWLIARWLSWRGFDPYLDHPFENRT